MKQVILSADVGRLPELLSIIGVELESRGCPLNIQTQISLAVEEIFVNIAHYAYDISGSVTINIIFDENERLLTLQFIDSGKPFNPLKKEDPNIELPLEEREVGGLGIFMIKEIMDALQYEFENGNNILTARKQF